HAGPAQMPETTRADPMPLPQRLGIALVLFLIPLLLLALPMPPSRGKGAVHKKDWVFAGAAVLAGLSLAAYLGPHPLYPRRKSTPPLLLLGTSVLLVAQCTWNYAYLHYVEKHPEYTREVFRRPMHNFWAPVYGRYDNSFVRPGEMRANGKRGPAS